MSPDGRIALSAAANGRADLRLGIAPVNVLEVADLERLADVVSAPGEFRVLVLSGLPRAFSAGVSLRDHEPDALAIDRMLGAMRGALAALLEVPAVTVAAVSGACLGGGAEIAAACDLVVAASDARIGFPEIGLACFPPGAAALLPAKIGAARAGEWILTGRTLSGREAAEAGFASRAVDAARLGREVDRLVAQLLSRSPLALAGARDLLRAARREALHAGLPRAEDAYRRLAGSGDLRRAVHEFGRGSSR